VKGLNIIILVAFIAFVIAIAGLTLNFFHVFNQDVFILNFPKISDVVLSIPIFY